MRKLFAALALVAMAGAASAQTMVITLGGGVEGEVRIQLRPDLAPKHVERLTELANSGAYDGVVFHRVIEGFMAQTGDVQFGTLEAFSMGGAGRGGSELADLPAEFSQVPYERGVLGMARSQSPDSANSQFFIMFTEYPSLNGQYTVVGEVVSGMEFVDSIKRGAGQSGVVAAEPDYMARVVVEPVQ
ncbi:MAG: peptidylprolyl isomerase [Paracoccaceae bacterium]